MSIEREILMNLDTDKLIDLLGKTSKELGNALLWLLIAVVTVNAIVLGFSWKEGEAQDFSNENFWKGEIARIPTPRSFDEKNKDMYIDIRQIEFGLFFFLRNKSWRFTQ